MTDPMDIGALLDKIMGGGDPDWGPIDAEARRGLTDESRQVLDLLKEFHTAFFAMEEPASIHPLLGRITADIEELMARLHLADFAPMNCHPSAPEAIREGFEEQSGTVIVRDGNGGFTHHPKFD